MSVPARIIPPEAVAVARRLYEETGVPMRDIADTIGINLRTLVRWVKDGAWAPRSRRLPKVTPAVVAPPLPPLPPPGEEEPPERPARRELIARLVRRIEAEIAAVERLLAGARGRDGEGHADSERAARTLAILVRSLRELAALDRLEPDRDDDDATRDADSFRRELGVTLERVLAGGEAG